MLSPGLVAVFAAGSLAGACSSAVPDDAGVETASGVGSLALVHVERQAEALEAPPRITSSVKVARYRGIDSDRLLRLLGADTRELDSCAVLGGLDDAPLPASAHVELMSVGTIGLTRSIRASFPPSPPRPPAFSTRMRSPAIPPTASICR